MKLIIELLLTLVLCVGSAVGIQAQTLDPSDDFPDKYCQANKPTDVIQTLNEAIASMSILVTPFESDSAYTVFLKTHVDMTCDTMSAGGLTVSELTGLGEVCGYASTYIFIKAELASCVFGWYFAFRRF
jgi:hypothetical protein